MSKLTNIAAGTMALGLAALPTVAKGQQGSWLFSTNYIDYGSNVYGENQKMFGCNMSTIRDSIIVHVGAFAYMGIHKAPVFIAQVAPDHTMNWTLRGNDLREYKSINFIEAPAGWSSVDLSKLGLHTADYDDVTLY